MLKSILQETGECRGFAFVDFPSIEYTQYFMNTFGEFVFVYSLFIMTSLDILFDNVLAGSAGDPNAQQLIIESRAVTIDYAYDKPRKEHGSSEGSFEFKRSAPTRTDWICEVNIIKFLN